MHGKGAASRFEFGTVTLIPDERLVLKDGRPVPFTPKAFDLLAELAMNPGRLLTKEQLMQAVWPDTTVEESNLTYHVFAMYRAHREGMSLPVTLPAQLSGSASLHDGRLTLSVVNTSPTKTIEALLPPHQGGFVQTLVHTELNAHNTPDQPDCLTPQQTTLPAGNVPGDATFRHLRLTASGGSRNLSNFLFLSFKEIENTHG